MSKPKEFQPTYLMVKWHPTDPSRRKDHKGKGLFYFCKTTRKNPLTYKGSGPRWNNHIKKHGKHLVKTLSCELFYDRDEIEEIALLSSAKWDIVKSKLWANQKPENGLDGGGIKGKGGKKGNTNAKGNKANTGRKLGPLSEERKENIRQQRLGTTQSQETKDKRSESLLGRIPWNKGTTGYTISTKGKTYAEIGRGPSPKKGKPWSVARRKAQENRTK